MKVRSVKCCLRPLWPIGPLQNKMNECDGMPTVPNAKVKGVEASVVEQSRKRASRSRTAGVKREGAPSLAESDAVGFTRVEGELAVLRTCVLTFAGYRGKYCEPVQRDRASDQAYMSASRCSRGRQQGTPPRGNGWSHFRAVRF